jgi:molybdopterin synthase sulfur carrier subunit
VGLVKLYGTLRPRAGENDAVEVPWAPGDTVATVIQALVQDDPEIGDAILGGDGELLPFVSVFVNGRDIRHLDGLDTTVDGESELVVFPPVAGG